jgi:hypothetical protein
MEIKGEEMKEIEEKVTEVINTLPHKIKNYTHTRV